MNETAATDPVLSKRPQSRVWRKLRKGLSS